MSILKSFSYAVTGALDTVGDSARTVQKTLAMASHFVDHKSQAWEKTVYETTLMDTAKVLDEIAADLEDNERLAKIHAKLAAEWKRPVMR